MSGQIGIGTGTGTGTGGMKRVSAFPIFGLPGSSAAAVRHSEQRMSAACAMPAGLKARLRLAECNSSRGPLIVLQAQMVLSGLEARVMFRASAGDTVERGGQITHRVVLVPSGEWLTRQAHSTRGIPGRGLISLRLVDGGGRPLAPEQEVGECVEGTTNFSVPFMMDASAVAWVGARDWSEQRGPLIHVSAEVVSTRGVSVRLRFRPSVGPMRGTGEGVTEFPLIRPGMSFYAREKSLEAGLSGSPWISLTFVGEGGRPFGGEHQVGRCVR
jgi:hypothetical protein